MFDGKYFSLKKNGTFGWTKLTYVGRHQGEEEGRAVVRPVGPGLFLDRRRLPGQGGQRRAAHREARAGQGGSADRAAGRARPRSRPLPGVRLSQHARLEELLCLRHALEANEARRRPARRSN